MLLSFAQLIIIHKVAATLADYQILSDCPSVSSYLNPATENFPHVLKITHNSHFILLLNYSHTDNRGVKMCEGKVGE